MFRRQTVLMGAVLAVSLGVAGQAIATPSGRGPGNSPNAHACQHGGWQALYTSTGQGFSNAGQCSAYAAHGGTFSTLPQQWQTTCLNGGGDLVNVQQNPWQCAFPQDPDPSVLSALSTICSSAGGTFSGYALAECEF
jgi:hypothetical protein